MPSRRDPLVAAPARRRAAFWYVSAAALLLAAILFAGNRMNSAGNAGDRIAAPDTDETAQRTAVAGLCQPDRAYKYLMRICDIGPRISGTPGMTRQQELLIEHFEKYGAKIALQEFDARHPLTGQPVRLANLIVSWHPQAVRRVLLCCHYDTRPFPDQELLPRHRQAEFLGANDGGSGVALFMELAHHLPALPLEVGVDFVFFDAEELVYDSSRDPYFLGSMHFATQYRDAPPQHRYLAGILVDMIGDKELTIYKERNSVKHARELTDEVWSLARELKLREFRAQIRFEILDDHLPLNEIAGIPTIDLIDFDYPHWHKRTDVPQNCSGASLAKVGNLLLEWLRRQGKPQPG